VEGYTNLLSLLAIPLLSGVYYAAFRRYRVHYAEHLVANVFFAGFYTVVGLLATGVLALLLRRFLGLLNPLLLLFQWAYLSVAYCGFLGFRRRGQYLAAAVVTGLALLTWIALSSGLIYLYIRYGLPGGGGS
jgi:hypothetical protein